MNVPVTVARRVTPGEVKSVIELEKIVFHVTSFFDETDSLANLLFAAASENLFEKPPLTRYNVRDD